VGNQNRYISGQQASGAARRLNRRDEDPAISKKLTWSDWKEILSRLRQEITKDEMGMVAAAVAYYALFAMFPLLIATVSIYGLFADPAEIELQVRSLSQLIPNDAAQIIEEQLSYIAANSGTKLGLSAVVSIMVALWTASSGLKALIHAMNIAYDEEEKRGFFRLQFQALFLTLGGVFTILVTTMLVAILPATLDILGLKTWSDQILLMVRWPVLALIFILSLSILNRFGPSRLAPQWRWISPGAVTATVIILLASWGLAFYIERFGSYNKTYGSIAGVIVLLLWLYMLSFAVLVGTELNAEIEHQTISKRGNAK
jgi:membrane protein